MGFKRQAFKLTWPASSRWHGLEVSIRDMAIGELEEVASLQENSPKDESKALARLTPVLDILENALISWNYEDEDGKPIPVLEFRKQGLSLIMAIIAGWTEVSGDVPPPLSQNSSNGKQSEEVSIPMVIPSESHPT